MKVNILKTFEIFNREAMKILAKRVINVFMLETPEDSIKGIFVDHNKKNETQITVVNNQKVYNLLTSAMYKTQKKLQQNENCKS
ncbi:MAG: hypothetical protein WC197_07545 [Candidatus Gastranaerophilaceae bacterium]|jgi:predicted transcriptional regulator